MGDEQRRLSRGGCDGPRLMSVDAASWVLKGCLG